jgi:hypothetical protein
MEPQRGDGSPAGTGLLSLLRSFAGFLCRFPGARAPGYMPRRLRRPITTASAVTGAGLRVDGGIIRSLL